MSCDGSPPQAAHYWRAGVTVSTAFGRYSTAWFLDAGAADGGTPYSLPASEDAHPVQYHSSFVVTMTLKVTICSVQLVPQAGPAAPPWPCSQAAHRRRSDRVTQGSAHPQAFPKAGHPDSGRKQVSAGLHKTPVTVRWGWRPSTVMIIMYSTWIHWWHCYPHVYAGTAAQPLITCTRTMTTRWSRLRIVTLAAAASISAFEALGHWLRHGSEAGSTRAATPHTQPVFFKGGTAPQRYADRHAWLCVAWYGPRVSSERSDGECRRGRRWTGETSSSTLLCTAVCV
jgi:hypothetical protein